MCGIIASIHANGLENSIAPELHHALNLLKHRGQDACGIATCTSQGRMYQCKGNGQAPKVFHDGSRVAELRGYMGIAHLRYATSGTNSESEAQPMHVNSPCGLSFAHNGNLINVSDLKRFLDSQTHQHVNKENDSELMLNIFAKELGETGIVCMNAGAMRAALVKTYEKCLGGWACTAMVAGFGIIGFRDPYGIRPLVLGSRPCVNGQDVDYMMASESVALTHSGYKPSDIVDILPGQAAILRQGSPPVFVQIQEPKAYTPDIFEYVYLARLESVIDGISVEQSRKNMGNKLGATLAKVLTSQELEQIDVVIPIPETSNTAAPLVAAYLKKPCRRGFVKVDSLRSFIIPGQKARENAVRRKLKINEEQFAGKNVLLIDDSIVRGTTSREIIKMSREAGARRVYFASCAPPIMHPHIYGIDIPSKLELVAHDRNIAQYIGADKIIFQKLDDLESACVEAASPGTEVRGKLNFEVGVFSGAYVTPIPAGYFDLLQKARGETEMKAVIGSENFSTVDVESSTSTRYDNASMESKVFPKAISRSF